MRKIKPQKSETTDVCIEEPREHYPYFSIDIEHLPEAKKWSIGSTYYVTLELKETGIDVYKNKKEEGGNVRFDITGIEVTNKKKENYKELPDIE